MKRSYKKVIILLISSVLLVIITVCFLNLFRSTPKVNASNLMDNVSANPVNKINLDDKFKYNTTDFSIKLFQKSISEQDNSLISPLSVMLALAMTANGADHETLSQMQSVIGNDISIQDMNKYLYTYVNSLPNDNKSKLNIANSIWFRNDKYLLIEDSFLQTNADYYNASAFKSAFNEQTVKDINNWVKRNTNGMIDTILDQIDDEKIMYLINAVMFDARWEDVYKKGNISDLNFTNIDGSSTVVDGMHSTEAFYLENSTATGFMKKYDKNNYRFVALLPNEGISLKDYINSLTGDAFINLISNVENTPVSVTLPKFKCENNITMNDTLKALGMPLAFSKDDADFRRLGTSSIGNIYIANVVHKTYITVDELGTKAGAVTKVGMDTTTAMLVEKKVVLDRPFIYAIIDNSMNLPIFIGTVINLD